MEDVKVLSVHPEWYSYPDNGNVPATAQMLLFCFAIEFPVTR